MLFFVISNVFNYFTVDWRRFIIYLTSNTAFSDKLKNYNFLSMVKNSIGYFKYLRDPCRPTQLFDMIHVCNHISIIFHNIIASRTHNLSHNMVLLMSATVPYCLNSTNI